MKEKFFYRKSLFFCEDSWQNWYYNLNNENKYLIQSVIGNASGTNRELEEMLCEIMKWDIKAAQSFLSSWFSREHNVLYFVLNECRHQKNLNLRYRVRVQNKATTKSINFFILKTGFCSIERNRD